jgi:3-hydroxyacyl-CoA dehydrogenase
MVRKIKQAAVIGSGIMGGGIAALLASAGVKTLLLDIVPFDLKEEEKNDPKARNRIVKAGFDNAFMARPALYMEPMKDVANVTIGNLEDDFNKLADCDWIVEVVVENVKIKQSLFQRIEKIRKPTTIVSTNTSGIPLKDMSEGLSKEFKQHFLGTHFFNPVRYMRLLEIIPGQETLPEILNFMANYGETVLGKGIVWAKDTPGFIGNRIGVQGMTLAMQLMLKHDMSIPEVDALFGPAMGRPKTAMFKTSDLVGLDVLGHVAKNTYDLVADDEARESLKLPEFVGKMIEKKLLGNKTKAGFYKTDLTPEWKKIKKVIDPKTLEYVELQKSSFPCLDAAKQAQSLPEKVKAIIYADDKGAKYAWEVIAKCLIYAANRIPEISDTIVDIDNAMKWGYNFETGPFESWDAIGVKQSVEKMEKDGMTVPQNVKAMLNAGNSCFYKIENGKDLFYDFASQSYKEIQTSPNVITLKSLKESGKTIKSCKSASLVDIGDDVFCVEFHTKMNALNGEIVDFISEIGEYAVENAAGLVIGNQAGGMPGAFSAGADLAFMLGLAKEKKWADIEAFIKRAQDALVKTRYAAIPVVAAPYGLTLGGGCEVCIGGADKIVAHSELYMGLVEIGVGLLPAGGGCTNLWRRHISAIPGSVNISNFADFFLPVFQAIAMAKFSNSAAEARTNGFLVAHDRIVFNGQALIGEAKKEVLKMASEGYAPPAQRPIRVLGQAAIGMANAELHNMLSGKYISEYDAFLARRIAFVIGGGETRDNGEISEQGMLQLERDAFVDFIKEEKTQARIEHMLKTGKPLRN